VQSGAAFVLSTKHVAEDPVEAAAVVQRGGAVIGEKVNGTLDQTRILGLHDLKPAASAAPSCRKHVVDDGQWIRMGGDRLPALCLGGS
jgi:hypothetical protein